MEYGNLTGRERLNLYLRLLLRLFLAVALVLAALLLFRPVVSLLGPFIAATITACILNPIIRWLHKKIGASRRLLSLLALIVVLAALISLVAWGVYTLAGEIVDLAANWESLADLAVETVSALADRFEFVAELLPDETELIISAAVTELVELLKEQLSVWGEAVLANVGGVSSSVASVFLAVVVYIMAVYFITANYPVLRERYFSTPASGTLSSVKNAVKSALGGYFKAQVILSALVFVILSAAFLVWGQPYSILIALFTAMVDFIPFFGSGIVLAPWAVVSFFMGDYAKAAFLAVLGLSLFLIRKFAEPKVVGDQTGLSPLGSLIAIYIGMRIGGVAGMILTPVVFMIFVNLRRAGIFGPTVKDLSLVAGDIRSFLRGGNR